MTVYLGHWLNNVVYVGGSISEAATAVYLAEEKTDGKAKAYGGVITKWRDGKQVARYQMNVDLSWECEYATN